MPQPTGGLMLGTIEEIPTQVNATFASGDGYCHPSKLQTNASVDSGNRRMVHPREIALSGEGGGGALRQLLRWTTLYSV